MNKRELRKAFVKAMNKIRKQPDRYAFMEANVPLREHGHCQGCLLAWIGFYAGQERGHSFNADELVPHLTAREREVYGADSKFYRRLDKLMKASEEKRLVRDWRDDAEAAVEAMKRYIKKHLTPKKRAA